MAPAPANSWYNRAMAKSDRITVTRVILDEEISVHPVCHKRGHKLGEPRKNPRYEPYRYEEGSSWPMPDPVEEGGIIPDRNQWIADCERCGDTLYCDGPKE